MHYHQLFTISLLANSAWAAPGPNFGRPKWKKAVCNPDNCFRAVKASSAAPFPSIATSDCSSFMHMTVTPCPVTTITQSTVVITVSPSIVTVTSSIDQTQFNTAVETFISPVTTIFETLTIIQPSQVVVTNIIATTVTQTAVAKRDLKVVPLPDVPELIQARATICTPSTGLPSRVPTYASACAGVARYSSACSCAGVTGRTTSLDPMTTTVTDIVTSLFTPTSTITATLTNSLTVTVTQTDIVPTTIVTTDATAVVPSFYTITTDLVVPTTVIITPPTCNTYRFVATNGFRAGQFLTGGRPPTQPNQITYGLVYFTSNPAEALTFNIRSDGRVYASGNGEQYNWVTNGGNIYYIMQMTQAAQNFYGIRSVFCSINAGSTTYPGAVGTLSCTSPLGSYSSVEYCPQTSNNLAQNPGSPVGGCTLANLAVVPAC